MKEERLPPMHPSEVLLEELLKPMPLSQNRLALDSRVHPRPITAETAVGLARYFGTSPQCWLGLQADYDRDVAMNGRGDSLERNVKTYAAAG